MGIVLSDINPDIQKTGIRGSARNAPESREELALPPLL